MLAWKLKVMLLSRRWPSSRLTLRLLRRLAGLELVLCALRWLLGVAQSSSQLMR